jgi:hypothetical protein
MRGIYEGVEWVKTQHADISQGFTSIIVNGEEVRFYGHKSNAQAWNYITKMTRQHGVTVSNGAVITKVNA